MKEIFDVIIIGAGPAGLTSAIYSARANLKTIVIESNINGGKLYKTYEIDNYPGVSKIGGIELAEKLVQHVKKYDVPIKSQEVFQLINEEEYKKVVLKNGQEIIGKTVIVATGTKEKELNIPKASKFTGRGISYCAVCDGFFYRKKDVVVIGGGNSALEESLYLANICNSVTIVIRRDEFRADALVVDEVKKNEKIKIIYKSLPDSLVIEDDTIVGLNIKNVETNEIRKIDCVGIFPYIGSQPCTHFLDSSIIDELGYVKVDKNMSTSIKGIYGAGDVVQKNLRQVITACNDGAIAANAISNFLKQRQS